MKKARRGAQEPVAWKLFFDGDDFYRALLRDLRSARHSIAFEMYIFDNGGRAAEIVECLVKLAGRVRVQILLDGIGSFSINREWLGRLIAAGADVRIFRPLQLYTLFRSGHMRRNHRKLIVIDREILYLGGMNIADVNSRRASGIHTWRDTMIRLDGVIGRDGLAAFEGVWRYTKTRHFFLPRRPLGAQGKSAAHDGFQLVANTPRAHRRYASRLLVSAIRSAKRSVWIQAAYFTPRRSVVRVLRTKAEQGVDVKIMCPGISDVPAVQHAGRALYAGLLKRGVRIFEYQNRVLHTKAVLIDGETSIIGSTNLDYRSFLLNLELDVLIQRSDVGGALAEQFLIDLENSKEIHLDEWQKRSFWQRVREQFFYWLRRYM